MKFVNLVSRQRSDNIMILSPALWFRIIFLFLTLAFAFGLYSLYGDLQESGEPLSNLIVPAVIGLICLAGALYEEIWIFDRKERVITHRSGIRILYKKSVYSFDEIETLVHVIYLKEKDGSADKGKTNAPPHSKPISGETLKKLMKSFPSKNHQELLLNVRNETYVKIEAIDSRSTDALNKKAKVLSHFTGFPLKD